MKKEPRHLATGKWGEKVAAKFLKKNKGYKILGRRIHIGTRDEFDLVARDGEVLVFVEVKTRASEKYGRASASVNRNKRHTLSRAAVRYIKKLRNPKVYFRFDVVEVIGDKDSATPPTIRHTENYFKLDNCYTLP